ncbi:MAG: ABC transporter ATP-binding protein, partial [Endomicrobiaceae bacterium]|nr:ABC transporter ATP-binding protein [Endomicrobiaceae bacterium]
KMKITAKNLIKNYTKKNAPEVNVLKGINLEIPSGTKASLTGPSGAGKSTLIHILGLMDKPTSGEIFIDGEKINNYGNLRLSKMRKDYIGFVFQFHYLLSDFNVLENILMPVWDKKSEKIKRADELLEMTGLSNRKHHLPSELSGGEQQRVALARALINNPKILFADEPTGNLDRKTGTMIENLMFGLCTELKTTLLVVTHNQDVANLADRQLKMVDGQIL